jgi:hypothetical protein
MNIINKNKLAVMIAATLSLGSIANAVEVKHENNSVVFDSLGNNNYNLKVLSPDNEIQSFQVNGESFTLSANMLGLKSFDNGQYKFELTPFNTATDLSNQVRELDDTQISKEYMNSFKATAETVSGVFSVANHSLVKQTDENTLKDQVILDDLIVDGSLCVGVDCVNGESFGFDTIRLKENNLRIKFDDTSSSGSFPNNDWQITANDSGNGGANKFSIDDITGSKTPFTILAGARTNALFVNASGKIGIGTSTPSVDLHVKTGNTPTLRLEQDGSSGFTAQTWDLAGNEANFFIRDVNHGSKLPFRIEPNTPSNALYLDSTGNIGMGTTSPKSALHVLSGGSAFTAASITTGLFQNNAVATDANRLTILSGNASNGQLAFGDADNEIAGRIRYNHDSDSMDFFTGGNVQALHLDGGGVNNVITNNVNGAVLTVAGVWQSVSTREAKERIEALTIADAEKTLEGLNPVTYIYKADPTKDMNVGFIAEDVPELVATSSRKTLASLDIIAVLTKVVQGQKEVISNLENRLEALEKKDKPL